MDPPLILNYTLNAWSGGLPMVAPGTVVLTVSNRTATPVPIMQLAVEVLAGPSSDDLAPIPLDFQLDIPSGWESTYQDWGWLFTPVSAPLSIESGQALVFTFSALPASALVGALAVRIHETSAAGTGTGIIPLESVGAAADAINEFIGRLFALSQAGNRSAPLPQSLDPNSAGGFCASLGFTVTTQPGSETIAIDLSVPPDPSQDPISLHIDPGASSIYPDFTIATDPQDPAGPSLKLRIVWPPNSNEPTLDGTLRIPL